MTRAERRIVLAMLFGLLLVGTAALFPAEASPYWLSLVWIGTCGAQVGLLVVWAALRRQPLWVRLSGTLRWWGWLAFALLLPVCYSYPMASFAVLLMLCSSGATLFLLFLIMRHWRRWDITLAEEWLLDDATSRQQFTVRHLLLWLAEVALLLGLFVWLLRDSAGPPAIQNVPRPPVLGILLQAAMLGALCLPMTMAGLVFALEERPRLRFGLGALLWAILLPPLLLLIVTLQGRPISWQALGNVFEQIGPVSLSYLVSFWLGLWVLRLCGYRLRRGRVAPDPVLDLTTVPGDGRSSFRALVVVLGLLFLAILWPAWQLQAPRREQATLNHRLQFWQQAGMGASPSGTGVAVVVYSRKLPELVTALQVLADPRHADEVQSLSVYSTPIWNDAAMATVAQLKELRALHLNGSGITDAGLVHLYGLKHLEEVNLFGGQITAKGVAQLQQALPDCRISSPFPTPPPLSR